MKAESRGRVRFSAVVTRADGSKDDYGTIMDTRWGRFRRWRAARRIKRINRKYGF